MKVYRVRNFTTDFITYSNAPCLSYFQFLILHFGSFLIWRIMRTPAKAGMRKAFGYFKNVLCYIMIVIAFCLTHKGLDWIIFLVLPW